MADLSVPFRLLEFGTKISACAVPHLRSGWGRNPFLTHTVVGNIQLLMMVSVLSWLLAREYPTLPVRGPLHKEAQNVAACSFKASEGESVPTKEALGPLWLWFSHCRVRLFATPWTAARQASLSITSSRSLRKLMSIASVMHSNHLLLCRPLPLLPPIFPSIRVFSNESALRIRWPKYCSFSFSISPSNEYSGLISFRMDWLDFLAVQGILNPALQFKSINYSGLSLLLIFFLNGG